jgi:hypothetical protein
VDKRKNTHVRSHMGGSTSVKNQIAVVRLLSGQGHVVEHLIELLVGPGVLCLRGSQGCHAILGPGWRVRDIYNHVVESGLARSGSRDKQSEHWALGAMIG